MRFGPGASVFHQGSENHQPEERQDQPSFLQRESVGTEVGAFLDERAHGHGTQETRRVRGFLRPGHAIFQRSRSEPKRAGRWKFGGVARVGDQHEYSGGEPSRGRSMR